MPRFHFSADRVPYFFSSSLLGVTCRACCVAKLGALTAVERLGVCARVCVCVCEGKNLFISRNGDDIIIITTTDIRDWCNLYKKRELFVHGRTSFHLRRHFMIYFIIKTNKQWKWVQRDTCIQPEYFHTGRLYFVNSC